MVMKRPNVAKACAMLKVSRTAFYDWSLKIPSAPERGLGRPGGVSSLLIWSPVALRSGLRTNTGPSHSRAGRENRIP